MSVLPSATTSYYEVIGLLATYETIESVEGIPVESFVNHPLYKKSNLLTSSSSSSTSTPSSAPQMKYNFVRPYPPQVQSPPGLQINNNQVQHHFLSHPPPHLSSSISYNAISLRNLPNNSGQIPSETPPSTFGPSPGNVQRASQSKPQEENKQFKVEVCDVCGRNFDGPKAATHRQQHIRRLHPESYQPKKGGKRRAQ